MANYVKQANRGLCHMANNMFDFNLLTMLDFNLLVPPAQGLLGTVPGNLSSEMGWVTIPFSLLSLRSWGR